MSIPLYSAAITTVSGRSPADRSDNLAVEEPLEIRLGYGPANNRQRRVVAVTMRTPGHDPELAAGYLVSEGVLGDPDEILGFTQNDPNSIRVDVKPGTTLRLDRLSRRGAISSSCGVCGKATLDAIESEGVPCIPAGPILDASLIHALTAKLRDAQHAFDMTGGLHAIGLFDERGELRILREDVGRHNALDKVIGYEFLAGRLPLHDRIVFATSRSSFELLQKAAIAGVAVFASVGAPSSLAVQLAERFGMTLIGFVREGRFNVYAGRERIAFRAEREDRDA